MEAVPDFREADYGATILWAAGEDGTAVPVSVCWHSQLCKMDGSNPLLLQAWVAGLGDCVAWAWEGRHVRCGWCGTGTGQHLPFGVAPTTDLTCAVVLAPTAPAGTGPMVAGSGRVSTRPTCPCWTAAGCWRWPTCGVVGSWGPAGTSAVGLAALPLQP